ncbi:MAG: helix-turn-helix transcriptional regulator [Aminipila sp.]
MTVAEKIKLIIQAEGYKQYAVAKKVGMSEKMFNALLNGRKTFDVKYLLPICKAIGKSPNQVLDYDKLFEQTPKQ